MIGITQTTNGTYWLEEYENNDFKASYKVTKVLYEDKSPFQEVGIIDTELFGRVLVLDGIVQTTTLDGHIYNEMISHIPIAYHPDPKSILVIGGGDCGVVNEIAKYPSIARIDMIEIDEKVVYASKKFLPEISGNTSDPRINFLFEDGARFVSEHPDQYDIIIVDSSDPIGPAEVLFQPKFYQDIHQSLKSDGLMVCQSQSPIFHADILKNSYSRIKELFTMTKCYTATVPTYPGGLWSFTLGSKKGYSPNPSALSKQTRYVDDEILDSAFILPKFLKQLLKDA